MQPPSASAELWTGVQMYSSILVNVVKKGTEGMKKSLTLIFYITTNKQLKGSDERGIKSITWASRLILAGFTSP